MTIQKIDSLDINEVKIPLGEYSKKKVFGEDFPVVLTDSGIYYWNWLSPEHTRNVPYEEITGIYLKTTDTYPFGFLDIFDNTGRHRLSGPNEKLKNSVIEGVTGAKTESIPEDNGQPDIEYKIKKLIEDEKYEESKYCLPVSIRREIKKITGDKIHPLSNKTRTARGVVYMDPSFATENFFIGISPTKDAGKKIEVIPLSDVALCYLYQKKTSNGYEETPLFEIYTIGDKNPYQFKNLSVKDVIKLMTSQL